MMRHALNGSVLKKEKQHFLHLTDGLFQSRLVHHQASIRNDDVRINGGLIVSPEQAAALYWNNCHGVAHLIDKATPGACQKHWFECLPVEPWWAGAKERITAAWSTESGRTMRMIATMSQSQWVAKVLLEGPLVVHESTSNPLSHWGLEDRDNAATMEQIPGAEKGQLRMINPDPLTAPLKHGTVLLDASEAAHIEALDAEIKTGSESATKARKQFVDLINKERQHV
jgi:hypothetical protein